MQSILISLLGFAVMFIGIGGMLNSQTIVSLNKRISELESNQSRQIGIIEKISEQEDDLISIIKAVNGK